MIIVVLICIVLIVSIIVLYLNNQDKTCTHKGVEDLNAEYTTDEEGKCKFVRCKDTTYIQDSTGICVLDQSGQGCTPEGTPDANAIYETNVSNVCEFSSCIIGYEVGENDICIMAELEDEYNGDDPEPDANDGDEDGGGGADDGPGANDGDESGCTVTTPINTYYTGKDVHSYATWSLEDASWVHYNNTTIEDETTTDNNILSTTLKVIDSDGCIVLGHEDGYQLTTHQPNFNQNDAFVDFLAVAVKAGE